MSKRVLIVDDDHAIAEALADALADEGYDAAVATNGEKALEAMRAARPDAVLADIMMPVLDGIELVERMRGDDTLKDVPVALMSAAAPTALRRQTDVSRYLKKPFALSDLYDVVAELVGEAAS